jgi:PAS domain S-box-containing protein
MLQAISGPSLEAGAESATLFFVDSDESGKPETAELVSIIGDRANPSQFPPGTRVPMQQFMLGRLVIEPPHVMRLFGDVEEAGMLDDFARASLQGVPMRGLAIIPLMLQERLLGLVVIRWDKSHPFTDREEQFFNVVGPQLAAIAENRRLLEKTRSAEERFRDIALSTSDWLWETDSERRITYRRARRQSMGYTAQEMTGRLLDDTIAPEDVERVRQTIREHTKRRQPVVDMHLWGLHKDGRRVYLSSSIVPILGSRRRLIGYRGVTKDITAEHSAEQRERLAYDVGQRMTAVLSLDELAHAIVNQIQQSFAYYHVHLFLYEPRTNILSMREGTGEAGRVLKAEQFSLPLNAQPSLVARAARTAQPVISNDVRLDVEHLPNPYLPDTLSEAAFPLMRGERLLGVLDVQAVEPERFSPAELRTLENLSAHAAIAIENARLYEAERAARARADALLEASRAVSSTLAACGAPDDPQ